MDSETRARNAAEKFKRLRQIELQIINETQGLLTEASMTDVDDEKGTLKQEANKVIAHLDAAEKVRLQIIHSAPDDMPGEKVQQLVKDAMAVLKDEQSLEQGLKLLFERLDEQSAAIVEHALEKLVKDEQQEGSDLSLAA